MVNSYFTARSADRTVTVWPSSTDESAFYDVVSGNTTGERYMPVTNLSRVTAREAACVIVTEVGVGFGATVESITRQIADWRAKLDAQVRESVR